VRGVEQPQIIIGTWPQLQALVAPIRLAVFVEEQRVPLELEWDEFDSICIHAAAKLGAQTVGTARLDPDGHIGRMAVLAPYRRRGVGGTLLQTLIDHARTQALEYLALNAQTHAIPFYIRHGFVAEGAIFDDAGIPHRKMTLAL
jgi:predicted GNAT family N-acyltransferase